MGDFGNSGMDGDPQNDGCFLPVSVIPHGDDNAQEQRDWEYIYCVGAVLREPCNVRRSDPNRFLVSIAASDGPLQYSDRFIDLLTSLEWDGNDNGQEMSGFNDPAAATATDTQWCLDTLLPAARQEVAVRRSPANGRPAGCFQGLDVSWTKPSGRMPVSYITPGMRTRRIHGAARSTWILPRSKMKKSAMRGEKCETTPCSGQCNFPAIQDKAPESIQGT